MKRRFLAVMIGGALMLSACKPEVKDVEETAARTTQAVVTTPDGSTSAPDPDNETSKSEREADGATTSTEEEKTTEAPKTTEAEKTTEAPQPTEPGTTEAVKPVETGEVGPVTIIVGKDVELDLAAGVGQVVRKIADSDGCACNTRSLRALKADEDGNIYRASERVDELAAETSYCVYVDALTYGAAAESQWDRPGSIRFEFDKEHSGLKGFSLLEGWNGDLSKLDRYMTNENSLLTYDHRVALFKNGKIVTVDELKKQYGEDAADLIDHFSGNLQNYIISKYNVHQGGLLPYMSLIAADTSDFNKLLERYNAMLQNEEYADYAEEFLTVGACMQVAMIDWGTSDENVQYGSIRWDRSMERDPHPLSVYVPCSNYEYNMVRHAKNEDEKGNIKSYESMTGGWKFLSYKVPDDFGPEDTVHAEAIIQAFEEAGLILGMTADEGILDIVMDDSGHVRGHYDDKLIYFSERGNDDGEFMIVGDTLNVIEPDEDIQFVFQRMTESELKRYNSMTDDELEAAAERVKELERERSSSK